VQEWASLLSSLLGEDVRIAPSNISSTRPVVVGAQGIAAEDAWEYYVPQKLQIQLC